jgi:DNA polymerase III alpha subunit
MKQNKHGEQIFTEDDLCNLIMQGFDAANFNGAKVDQHINLETAALVLDHVPHLIVYDALVEQMTTEEFDYKNQQQWFMPDFYKTLDIAEHVLNLCTTAAELQRCGQELLMFQERGLFNLLRYLKYLLDTMTENKLIWGVGRGSSVASFVLYKLGVHQIDSLHYDLDPSEFLR